MALSGPVMVKGRLGTIYKTANLSIFFVERNFMTVIC